MTVKSGTYAITSWWKWLYVSKIGDLCNNQLVDVVGGKTGRQWLESRQWLKEGCRTYITVKLDTYGITTQLSLQWLEE